MGLLAESRSRRKISSDPNNTKWSRDTTTFGQKILRSQGWQPGQYLGAENAPHSGLHTAANSSYIRVALKDDAKGLGFDKAKDDEVTGLDVFSDLLSRLNGKSEESVESDRQARLDVKRNLFVEQRWGPMRFVRGGLLVGDDMRELQEENKSAAATSNSSDESTESDVPQKVVDAKKSKRSKKRKARGDEDGDGEAVDEVSESRERKRRKEERKAKKARQKESESESKGSSKEKKEKKRKQKTEKKSREVEAEESSADDRVERAILLPPQESSSKKAKTKKSEKARDESKQEKKERKRRKKAEAAAEESASESSTTPAVGNQVKLAASSGVSSPSGTGTSTPLGTRNFVRSRFIAQKKQAVLDTKALEQIFMLKA